MSWCVGERVAGVRLRRPRGGGGGGVDGGTGSIAWPKVSIRRTCVSLAAVAAAAPSDGAAVVANIACDAMLAAACRSTTSTAADPWLTMSGLG